MIHVCGCDLCLCVISIEVCSTSVVWRELENFFWLCALFNLLASTTAAIQKPISNMATVVDVYMIDSASNSGIVISYPQMS